MLITSQWCSSRSRMAVARTSSPSTPPHSAKDLLEVMIMVPRSYLRETSWNPMLGHPYEGLRAPQSRHPAQKGTDLRASSSRVNGVLLRVRRPNQRSERRPEAPARVTRDD